MLVIIKRSGLPLEWVVAALVARMNFPVGGASAPPDPTQGETNGGDRKLTETLGPTGLREWSYTKPAKPSNLPPEFKHQT